VPAANEVVLGGREGLLAAGLRTGPVNWLCDAPKEPLPCAVKIRYRHTAAAATVTVCEGGAVVRFEEPQSAVTPGQAAVFYDGERVLGGGWIEEALSSVV
jgi:tRNA-specific 2-thiouridylase